MYLYTITQEPILKHAKSKKQENIYLNASTTTTTTTGTICSITYRTAAVKKKKREQFQSCLKGSLSQPQWRLHLPKKTYLHSIVQLIRDLQDPCPTGSRGHVKDLVRRRVPSLKHHTLFPWSILVGHNHLKRSHQSLKPLRVYGVRRAGDQLVVRLI